MAVQKFWGTESGLSSDKKNSTRVSFPFGKDTLFLSQKVPAAFYQAA